jgi:ribonuclease P protein component
MRNDLSVAFKRDIRLLTAANYTYVFTDAQRFGNHCFTLLVRKNTTSHARLGLAIAKKSAKRAVDRNRIKRIIRESFRHLQHDLPNIDVVIMCRPAAIDLSSKKMRKQLDRQWSYICRKIQT